MHAPTPSPFDARGEWRRGWPVVLGALVGIGAGPGLYQNLSSLFIPGLIAEFGWTRGQIATAAGFGLVGAIAAPFLGRAADRIGVRPVIAACMLLLGGAYLAFVTFAQTLWHYQLLILCLAVAVSGTSSVVYGRPIARAFRLHRGLALGVATSGLPLTTLLAPLLLGAVIARYGWRGGFVALAILTTLVALPLALIALRHVALPIAAPGEATTRTDDPSGAQARRDPRLWRLALTGFFTNLATIGFVSQMVPFGVDHGLPPGDAALLLVSFGASQIAARLVIGALVDRRAPHHVAATVALLSAAGFALLQTPQPGFALLVGAVFLAGLMNGAENDLLPFFAARLFGLRAYGEVYGSLIVVALLGTAIGIVGFGRLHDATGGDGAALGISAVALVVASALFLSLRGPARSGG